jgi:hypothetical protein
MTGGLSSRVHSSEAFTVDRSPNVGASFCLLSVLVVEGASLSFPRDDGMTQNDTKPSTVTLQKVKIQVA